MTFHTCNFVDVLEGQTQRFVSGAGRWQDRIQSIEKCLSSSIALLALNVPSFEPGHLQESKEHINPRLNHLHRIQYGNET